MPVSERSCVLLRDFKRHSGLRVQQAGFLTFLTEKPLFLLLLFHPVLIFLLKAPCQVYKNAIYTLFKKIQCGMTFFLLGCGWVFIFDFNKGSLLKFGPKVF